jgi:hypothetical protein
VDPLREVVLVVLAVLVASAPGAATAQGLLDLEGRWQGSCPRCAPGAMPGGFARTLIIRVSAAAITIQEGGLPAEVYQLDGSDTQLRDGRTATAIVENGGLVLTTVRTRARNRDAVFQTILRSIYRVSGNTLTIERSARAIRPNEPPSEKWASIGTVVYQRD